MRHQRDAIIERGSDLVVRNTPSPQGLVRDSAGVLPVAEDPGGVARLGMSLSKSTNADTVALSHALSKHDRAFA